MKDLQIDENYENSPLSEWENSNSFSKWTFSVANPMLNIGSSSVLQYDNLMKIPSRDYSVKQLRLLKYYYKHSKGYFFLPRLLIALLRCSIDHWMIVNLLSLIEAATQIILPIILIYLLRSLSDENATYKQFMWAGIMSGIGILQTIIHHVNFFFSMRMGWNWKTSCTAFIHDRLFSLNSNTLQSSGTGTGKLVNMISNDVARFEEFAVFGGFFYISMLQLIAVLVILSFILDFPSAIAGVGSTLFFIPFMLYFATLFSQYRTRTAIATDQRVRHISEVIDGIASVKSFAWEVPFFHLIRSLRVNEKGNISKSQVLRAINQGLQYASPAMASFATFAVYWGQGKTLTIPIIFATLSLLQSLKMSVGRMWTRSIETGSEVIASCYRIEAFLSMVETTSTNDNLESDKNDDKTQLNNNYAAVSKAEEESKLPLGSSKVLLDSSLIKLSKSSFQYGEGESGNVVLQDIEFEVKRGEILIVVGPVGCGKSSLLGAALGEMISVDGKNYRELNEKTRIAYCSQRPWIFAASIKANIALAAPVELGPSARQTGLDGDNTIEDNTEGIKTKLPANEFKHPSWIDLDLYSSAVESCNIVDDLLQWPAYDDTEVGERGVSISGGQKARISLARAVYSDSDLYILDDPLSAVDAHVGKALFFNCIYKTLRNRNKGIILVTHQLQYLKHADKVLVLDKNGRQTFYGSYSDVQADKMVNSILELNNNKAATNNGSNSENSENLSAVKPSGSSDSLTNIDDKSAKVGIRYDPDYRLNKLLEQQQNNEDVATQNKNDKSLNKSAKNLKGSTGLMRYESVSEAERRTIISAEDKAEGKMGWHVFRDYIVAGGLAKGIFAIMMVLVSQVASMIQDYWLKWWATNTFGNQKHKDYVYIYAALTVLCMFIGFYRALSWFSYTLNASSNLHESCLWAVMRSPSLFFIANPTGRILNRFAKDQNQADESLPVTLFDFLQSSIFCLAAVVLVCVSIPWLILIVPPLGIMFYYLRNRYICSTREIKRLEAITRSPIYADFSATLDGLVTLRAYKLEKKVSKLFQAQLDINGRTWFSFLMASRWLGFRLDLETSFILTFVSFFAVILRPTIDVGLIGYTLVYTMSLAGLFQWTVRQSAEVEAQMTAIERICSYSALPSEPGYHTTFANMNDPPLLKSNSSNDSTKRGNLSLVNLSVKYRLDLDNVLSGISVDIPAGYKVGVCGRTGSGKSSLLLALLRLNLITGGDIVLDGESLLKMDLETARRAIAMIPQDPHLFSGTIRFNLDPFSVYTDEEIWSALKDSHIYDFVRQEGGLGLSMLVEEGGKNFSVGQRQLLSLARATLRKCSVILMDEVTASIDFLTDRLIQETIRQSPALREATIITIAHRLRTIADSDLIVVIDKGQIVETGKPIDLLTKENSQFYSLAHESNEFEDILKLASSSSPLVEYTV
eukprot:gene11896-15916_t